MTTTPTIEIRPATERFHTRLDWLDSWHCFSFATHYDPTNVGHGLLLVSNDDTVDPGAGFTRHAHRDMEIVTWVLEGELEHRDSTGTEGIIYPGLAQRMSAGRGIAHSETNPSAQQSVHFVQMWVPPDTTGLEPSYEQRDVSDALHVGGLAPVASGRGHEAAVAIHQRGAVLWVGRLRSGEPVTMPDAPHVHLFVARGSVGLGEAGALSVGDAARLTSAGPVGVEPGPDGAEVLVWETA
jgi:quercetin 2,3-dioxygenase